MNSRSSSINFLAAVVALIIVCNALPVLPPARLAGHKNKSAVGYINITGAKSRIASRRENSTKVRNTSIVCCESFDAIVKKSVDQTCLECKNFCSMLMKVFNGDNWHINNCRCPKTKSCPNIGYVRQVTFDGGDTKRTQNNFISSSSSTRYGSFATAAAYKTVFYRTSCISCISMLVISVLYVVFSIGHNQYSTYVQHLMMCFTLLTYVNAVAQLQKRPTIDDFRLSGM